MNIGQTKAYRILFAAMFYSDSLRELEFERSSRRNSLIKGELKQTTAYRPPIIADSRSRFYPYYGATSQRRNTRIFRRGKARVGPKETRKQKRDREMNTLAWEKARKKRRRTFY